MECAGALRVIHFFIRFWGCQFVDLEGIAVFITEPRGILAQVHPGHRMVALSHGMFRSIYYVR